MKRRVLIPLVVMAVGACGASTATSTPKAAAGVIHCTVRGNGLYVLPDPICTPGAYNPAVNQSTIWTTICKAGWTTTVRPPVSVTTPLKRSLILTYGMYAGTSATNYELDHLVPLELGGATIDHKNLWPEKGPSRNPKDNVEDAARRSVCAGRMSLAAAQVSIQSDWVSFGKQLGVLK